MQPYKCTYCDKAYSHRIDLKRHTQSHTGKYSFTCEYPDCGKGYSKKSAYDSRKNDLNVKRIKSHKFYLSDQSTHAGQMLYKVSSIFKS